MRKIAITGAVAMLASLLMVISMVGTAAAALPGSNFEIDTDANLRVDGTAPPALDWANVTETRQTDTDSGPTDESFVQGTKEDTAVPVIETGGIPPNKSDLLTFGSYLETNATGKFLNIYWHRVQEPQGTTNMDFEFNKSETLSANGVTPVRSEGDVLIQYDLPSGGSTAQLFISRWVVDGPNSQCEANGGKVPCWNDKIDLTAAGDAVGTINSSTIPLAESDGLGEISPRTFGEAQIDFGVFAGTGCVGFGSAYLKSRSSDSFTSALKDFIPPVDLNFDECGALKVSKTVKTPGSATPQGQADVEFTIEGQTGTFTTDANGEICVDGLQAGDYDVTETVPSGYKAAGATTKTGTVVADGSSCSDDPFTGTTVSFTNIPLTDLAVTVTAQDPGATLSTIVCEDAANTKVIDVSTFVDPASGSATGLEPGTYDCTIVIDP